jgi:hypothetical protein
VVSGNTDAPPHQKHSRNENNRRRDLFVSGEFELFSVHDQNGGSDGNQGGKGSETYRSDLNSSREKHDQQVDRKDRHDGSKSGSSSHVEAEEGHKKHAQEHEVGGPDVGKRGGMAPVRDVGDAGNGVGNPLKGLLISARDSSHWPFRHENQPEVENRQKSGQGQQEVLVSNGTCDQPAESKAPHDQTFLAESKHDSGFQPHLYAGL